MEPFSHEKAPKDVNVPFTRAERMQQLAQIDHDITSLLEHAGKSIQSLGKPPSPAESSNGTSTDPAAAPQDQDQPNKHLESTEEQAAAFKDATNDFLATLHSVDTRLKRQIWGLEEAGIISLKVKDQSVRTAPGTAGTPSVVPNGVGMIGGLDVGWLNSRSSKVERDMEAELWTKARSHLDGLAERGGRDEGQGDVEMSQ